MGRHTRAELEETGSADGLRDAQLISECPGNPPLGPDPGVDWSFFYHREYDPIVDAALPHMGCKSCREGK